MAGYLYLASPYSHPDPRVREARYRAVCRVAARLIRGGRTVFCPVAHSHPIAAIGLLDPLDHTLWMAQDEAMLRGADTLAIVMLDGFMESRGIAAEAELARDLGIPCEWIEPLDEEEATAEILAV